MADAHVLGSTSCAKPLPDTPKTASNAVNPGTLKRKALLHLPVTIESDEDSRTVAQSPRLKKARRRGDEDPDGIVVTNPTLQLPANLEEEAEMQDHSVHEGAESKPDSQPIYSVDEDSSTVDVDDLKSFISLLPPLNTVLRPPCGCPPKRAGTPKVSLVLDLDETLVHSSTQPMASPDFVFPVQLRDELCQVHVRVRPYALQFLQKMSEIFEIIVFTASQKVYADELLNLLDPEKRWIEHRVFRESCVIVEGNYLKDLSVLGRDLSQIVIIDNSPVSFSYHLDNGVPIESWFSCQQDQELLKLVPFLESISKVDDVQPHVYNKFWRSNGEARRLASE